MKPEFVEIEGKKYKINTDFRIALECNKISKNYTIGEYEKVLAIIYKLFGEEGLSNKDHHQKLIELGQKYLLRGKEFDEIDLSSNEIDMDFEQDINYITASFRSDYLIDLNNEKYIHWWEFCDLLNGLTEQCVLNRVREIRNIDLNDYKDSKTRKKIEESKRMLALKTNKKPLSEKQKESKNKFYELAGLNKK